MHEFISLRTGGKDKDKHGATTLRGHMEKPEVGKTWKYRQQHTGEVIGGSLDMQIADQKECLRAVVYSKTGNYYKCPLDCGPKGNGHM